MQDWTRESFQVVTKQLCLSLSVRVFVVSPPGTAEFAQELRGLLFWRDVRWALRAPSVLGGQVTSDL